MTDRTIPFDGEGGRYRMAAGYNDYCALEEEFGEGINRVIARFSDDDNLRLTEVRRYIRVVLRRDGVAMSPEHVDDACNAAGGKVCLDATRRHMRHLFEVIS